MSNMKLFSIVFVLFLWIFVGSVQSKWLSFSWVLPQTTRNVTSSRELIRTFTDVIMSEPDTVRCGMRLANKYPEVFSILDEG